MLQMPVFLLLGSPFIHVQLSRNLFFSLDYLINDQIAHTKRVNKHRKEHFRRSLSRTKKRELEMHFCCFKCVLCQLTERLHR